MVLSHLMPKLLDSPACDDLSSRTRTLVLRRSQLAVLLGISPSTLIRMLDSGLLSVAPLPWPGHPRWSRTAVSVWVGGEPDMPDDAFRLLTVPETARHLGISRSSAYRALPAWVAAGAAVRCVSDWRVPAARLPMILGPLHG